jgi:hypothetical protein
MQLSVFERLSGVHHVFTGKYSILGLEGERGVPGSEAVSDRAYDISGGAGILLSDGTGCTFCLDFD